MAILRGESTVNSIPRHTLLSNCIAQGKPASPYSVSKRKQRASRQRQSTCALSTRLRQAKFVIKPSRSTSLTTPIHFQDSLRVRIDQPSTVWSGRLRSGPRINASSIQPGTRNSLRRAGLTKTEPNSTVGVFLCCLIVGQDG
jgi:hypothetical protein